MTRKMLTTAIVTIASLMAFIANGSAAPSDDTIKIGLLTIDSGTFTDYSVYATQGASLAIDTINARGGVAGHKLELVTIAHAGTPASALDAASRMVQVNGAKFLTGLFTSSIALALSPKVKNMGAIMVDPLSFADDQTGKNCQENYFRVSTSNSIVMNGIKNFLQDKNIKSWNMLASDYSYGHDATANFEKIVDGLGGTMDRKLFSPLGTNDYGTYISQLADSHSEGLMIAINGHDPITFAKQQAQFGLFQKYKMILGSAFVNEGDLGSMGDSALGVFQVLGYNAELPGDKNEAFVAAFRKKYGLNPNYAVADQYVAVEMLGAAIEKAQSADLDKVKAALSGLSTNTIYGDVEMRAADHQLIRQVVAVQVVKNPDGKPTLALKLVEPGPAIAPAVSPACKM